MKLAQTLVIAWFLTRLAIHALYHGDVIKTPVCRYNFWRTVIDVIITAGVLYWGGFWDCLL